jgi:hypothetical protein
MSWLEFTAQLLNAIGWPAAAVVIALVLRRPLVRILGDPTLKTLKAGPFEAAWERAAAAVERSTAKAIEPQAATSVQTSTSDSSAPINVVRRNYGRLVEQLQSSVRSIKPDLEPIPSDIVLLASIAREGGAISPESENAVQTLAALYDLAQMSPERLTEAEAADFRTYSRAMITAMQQNARARSRPSH